MAQAGATPLVCGRQRWHCQPPPRPPSAGLRELLGPVYTDARCQQGAPPCPRPGATARWPRSGLEPLGRVVATGSFLP